jgi:hypothetical protein
MIKQYKEVDLDDAEAGMVLAASVLDHQGSVLLPAGAPLSEQLLTSMRRRGIDSVRIVDESVSSADLAAARERVTQRLAHLFRGPDGGAAHALLRGELDAYRTQGMR